MLQLANILHSEGFNITIIHTSFNSPNKSNYPHFTFETISQESLPGFPIIPGSVKNFVLLNNVCFDPFRDCVKRLLSNSSTEDRILCLITDALLYFTQAVADLLKIPRIVLRTSSLSAFHVLYLRPMLLQKGYLSVEDSHSGAPVLEVQPLKVKDILRTYKIEGEDLDEIISATMTGTKAASGIIWNTFKELEQSVLPTIQQNFPIPNFTIGPFNKYLTASASSLLEQDQTAISWLDMQAPLSVLYVSFGSVAAIDKSEFFEMAWGLANSKQKFLWVVRPGSIRGSEWLREWLISGMMTGTKAASAIIWNTFEELEQSVLPTIQQNFPIPSFTIGPFHKYFTASASSLLEQDQTAISWLDTQAPLSVLYVSFGSVALIDKSEFLEMAWALANSKQKFLWVVRPGVIRGSEWLEPFPDGLQEAVSERGHIVKWAPQQEVLAHPATACFWSHCGWNSTLESICEGVPMICSPCFGDQSANARYVEAVWKVGLVLENGFEREEITRAIRRVMIDEEGKEMKMRMSCLKEKVNLCLIKGGSSYKSLEGLVNFILSL